MKKRNQLLAVVFVLVGLSLFYQPVGDLAAQEKPIQLKVAAAPAGTSYYAYSAPMGAVVDEHSKNPKIKMTVSTSGGGIVNIGYLNSKETDIACCQTGNAWMAFNKLGPFKEKVDLRAILVAEWAPFFFAVPAESNIKTLSDIVGKKTAPGAPGSGTAIVFKETVDALGLKVKESDMVYIPFSEGVDAMADGKIDVWFTFLSANIDALAARKKIRFISLTDAEIETINKKLPYVPRMDVAGGTVKGVDQPTVTISTRALWVCRPDMDPKIVEEIARVICEHKEVVQNSHRNSRMFDAKFAASETVVPYHDGALKYYKSVGAK